MNDVKRYINKFIVEAFIIIFCYLLQVSIFSQFPLANVTPNIMICLVATYGFMKGQKKGLVIGFICGLLLDIFSGLYFGMYAMLYMYIGYLNGHFKKLFFGDELRLPLVLIASSDFIYGLAVYVVLFLTRNRYSFSYYMINIILPEMIYTVLVSIFVYYMILHINNQLDKLEKKGSDRFGTY